VYVLIHHNFLSAVAVTCLISLTQNVSFDEVQSYITPSPLSKPVFIRSVLILISNLRLYLPNYSFSVKFCIRSLRI
jgi:hypothetical protein